MSLPFARIPNNIVLNNGGIRCDMLFGPCNCGAWHGVRTEIKNDPEDIMRAYIFFLLGEGKKYGKSRI